MIKAPRPKEIRVMLTAFRDGLQSMFGGKVRLDDFLPAMRAAVAAGVRHFEFGGGARYQAPFFYCGEDPFATMERIREAVGPGVVLQILTRSVSGVTLETQNAAALGLQARLMRASGTDWDRNFDFMNDVDCLVRTGAPIVAAGMHHQVCVAMMGLPFPSVAAHTAEFYVDIARRILASGMHFDSFCLKDASGTTTPEVMYETARGIRALLPPEVPLWAHTHDTASTAVACYLAAIAGGCDGIDLSVRPLASGTVQPDVRSMAHALKGTGYSLDVDATRVGEIETALTEGLRDYEFNPVVVSPDARVVGFPMPGGAIGPNVQMMAKAGILDRYSDVLSEFPVVVEAGGCWTSVTPGSQQYWLQAFSNVLHGRWTKIDPGYGRSILGYFGHPPLPPDPKVVELASAQLGLEPFSGNPLDAAFDALPVAHAELAARGLPTDERSVFLVVSAMVPGKDIALNEGLRFLTGKAKVDLPLKAKAGATPAPAPAAPAAAAPPVATGVTTPVVTTCTVEEAGVTRTFRVTIAGPDAKVPAAAVATPTAGAASGSAAVPVFSPFEGSAPVVELRVRAGETVHRGQPVAAVEAMKAKHQITAPIDGTVHQVLVALGEEVDGRRPILTVVPES